MLKKILVGLAILIAVFLVVVAIQPTDFQVTRSVTIAAPAPVVFRHVNDFHLWSGWSPWEKLDPAMKRNFAGPSAGAGAIYEWAGDRNVGAGRMTVVESRPAERILIQLEFFQPMSGLCPTEFTFRSNGSQSTTVTWTMSGLHNFVEKAMCLFMSMDKMVGGQFETGLAKLKSLAEAEAK